jgi:pyruvate/2-oxoglutarate dehydrogenase complex dihydrolipoamide acyltransferase (E2) component
MNIQPEDYETLGKFYLGRDYDLEDKKLEDELLLYDSKDLVTHGVVLGMTGSGKTGLCFALLEEAAMDKIPAIVIDPKGDITNLLLTFPNLAPEDFRPWINESDAAKKGVTPDEYAAAQAETWRKGLADWGQGPERIRAFRDKVDLTIYTPGSNTGVPVSILSSLEVPGQEVLDDNELFSERIESTVTSLLSLIGVDADPIQDWEHILVSNIFSHCWRNGMGITLETLIHSIQIPPFQKIGVMDVDTVCPEKERLGLAMKMNNLLASPGFSTWLSGDPLDIQRMMHTPEGKPRISIFSIAHLSDTERMFFVSLLLNQMLGWMRSQSGTSSLRALLYMDEIYGYLPPSANPPSKKPMMTMLKQARAFGLGVLLATQNPVDLDYKALSNIGTWFLGRLQTERDKMRVLDGLAGASASQNQAFDRQDMENGLSALGARVFLMNNVHGDGPQVFHVRWVMSYLRGPLSRKQIQELMAEKRGTREPSQEASNPAQAVALPAAATAQSPVARPKLPRGADEYFVPAAPGAQAEKIHYAPAVIRLGEVRYVDAGKSVNGTRQVTLINPIEGGTQGIDWNRQLALPNEVQANQLSRHPLAGTSFSELPNELIQSKFYSSLKKEFEDWLYSNDTVTLFHSPLSGMYSAMGESDGDFRVRLMQAAREIRDEKVADLQQRFEKKIHGQEASVQRAMDQLAEQKGQATNAKMDTAMRIGSTLLGAVFGKKFSLTRGRTAMSGASRAWKESGDVGRAEEKVERLRKELAELQAEAGEELAALKEAIDPMKEKLEEVHLTPLKKNCSAKSVGIVWFPQ